MGVNGATPDATNQFAANLDAALFNNDGGDVILKLNKAASADNAGISIQTNYSTRAEISVNNGNDLEFKTSPDGSSFKNGIGIEAATGNVSLGNIKDHNATVTIRNTSLPSLLMLSDSEDNITFKMADAQDQNQHMEMTFHCGSKQMSLKVNNNLCFTVNSAGRMKYEIGPELPQFSRTALPSSSVSAQIIYIYDANGGAGPAYFDGGGWKMMRDGATP